MQVAMVQFFTVSPLIMVLHVFIQVQTGSRYKNTPNSYHNSDHNNNRHCMEEPSKLGAAVFNHKSRHRKRVKATPGKKLTFPRKLTCPVGAMNTSIFRRPSMNRLDSLDHWKTSGRQKSLASLKKKTR
jgi:hypothetical protein